MNRKKQKRLMVLNEVEVGKDDGHGGITVIVPFPAPHKERVLELALSTYAGCNSQRFTELL